LLIGVSGERRYSTSSRRLDSRQHQITGERPDEPTAAMDISTDSVLPSCGIVSHIEDAPQIGILGSAEVEVFLDTEQLAGR
jgi:hypothetical protein